MQFGSPQLKPHARRATGSRRLDEKMKHKLAGLAIDPSTYLHESLLGFDHHAAGQRALCVRTKRSCP